MSTKTLIQVEKTTAQALKEKKLTLRDTYNEIIKRLLLK
jgi:hypothetical protein